MDHTNTEVNEMRNGKAILGRMEAIFKPNLNKTVREKISKNKPHKDSALGRPVKIKNRKLAIEQAL